MSVRILLDSNDRRPTPNDFVKGTYTDSQKPSSPGVGLDSGLSGSFLFARPDLLAPCRLSQEVALSLGHID